MGGDSLKVWQIQNDFQRSLLYKPDIRMALKGPSCLVQGVANRHTRKEADLKVMMLTF